MNSIDGPLLGGCMLKNSRDGSHFGGCMLMNSNGGPPFGGLYVVEADPPFIEGTICMDLKLGLSTHFSVFGRLGS